MNPYKSHQIETSVWRVSLMALGLAILFLYLKNVSYHVKISKTVRKKPFVAKVSVVLVSKTHRRDKCLTKRWLCALFCVSATRNRSAHNLPGILSLHFLFMNYKGIQVKFHSIFPIYEAFLWFYSINEKEKNANCDFCLCNRAQTNNLNLYTHTFWFRLNHPWSTSPYILMWFYWEFKDQTSFDEKVVLTAEINLRPQSEM